jgi:hypothetical protein
VVPGSSKKMRKIKKLQRRFGSTGSEIAQATLWQQLPVTFGLHDLV